MTIDDTDTRAKRLKGRCEIRRKGYMNKIRSIHNVAIRCAEDPSVMPQLLVMVDTLDQLMSSFNTEDEALLDQLLDMGFEVEYSDQESVEMLELASFIRATANRFAHYAPDKTVVSVFGGSQVSLNNAGETEPQSEEHFNNDNGAVGFGQVVAQPENTVALRSSGVQNFKPTRLPEIPLPTFHGDIYKWISFRDRFTAMVDRRSTLSNIEKFYYLVGCCKGDALDAIRGIPVSDQNYNLAWSTLEERFDKPRLVACSLIDKLLSASRASSETLIELNKFLVVFDEGVSVLDLMQIPDLGDFILFSIASRCLPTYSIKLFEAQLTNSFPTVQELLKFVKSRVAILECIPREITSKSQGNDHKATKGASCNVKKMPLHTSMVTSSNPTQAVLACLCCKGAHALNSCSKFKGWAQETRNTWARDQRLCFRCLRTGHWVSKCKSSIVCGQCSRRHHSLLHPAGPVGRLREENLSNEEQHGVATTSSLLGQNTSPSVILGTALIHMPDSAGMLHTVRALIDSASQISAITSECTNRLGLRMRKWTVPVSGLGGVSVQNVLGIVKCRAQPRFSPDPVFNFDAWVFPSITADMPRHPLSRSIADKYQHLALADPSFINPGTIDVLLGADLFAQILNGKRVSVGDAFPVAFGTVFGWTVIGTVPNSKSNISVSCPTSLTTSVEMLSERFWTLEEPDAAPEEFMQEGKCETIFREGCTRDSSGRFCVPLLFRQLISDSTFCRSRAVAEKRFEHLEKELADTANTDIISVSSAFKGLKTTDSNWNIEETSVVKLDVAELNDIPTIYSVPILRPYEFAAVGIWIHPNIVPGFKYKVRPIEDKERTRFLFDNRVLELLSIGRGYSRRLTFEASAGSLKPAEQLPEFKIAVPTALVIQEEHEWYERFSSYVQAVRVTARILRFIARCRTKPVEAGYLSRNELDHAALLIARSSQQFQFGALFRELSQKQAVSSRLLARLRPFIDGQGIIRVGGRLSRSDLPDDQKHPVLLAKVSHFSVLIIRHWHDITGHGGPQIVSNLVCRHYWILSVRTLIRTVISRCTICVRITAENPQPMMADLPSSRVTECHPFMRVGVDYAGPFSIKENRLRKARQFKMYIAVFVCFTVRAVHLEYVSDLSTEAFIAALHRFVARRGLPTDVYSDCGTNFVGADNLLRGLVNSPACRDQLTASIHCTWHFNPPGAPHFGGLWEAAVRSKKYLLVCIMGEHAFTIEEFGTVLCQIESIRNSRPLNPASSDPAELECLTPGHFLIGRPLLAVPEAEIPFKSRSLTQRWKLINQCVQAFWRRWRNEYLQTLQMRSRWVNDAPNIEMDDMVVIKDPQTPPLKWRMGRVIAVQPGADKVVRVVQIRTATGTVTRPVVKVVKLPISS